MTRLVERMLRADKYQFFHAPVDPVALNLPDYAEKIKRPMDLGTVRNNLESGIYASDDDCAADIRLALDNALAYNAPHTIVYHVAVNLSKMLDREIRREEAIPLSFLEKQTLGRRLEALPPEHVPRLIELLGVAQTGSEEVEVDFDRVDTNVLRRVQKYVHSLESLL